jgi:hypothetical protein
MVRRDDGSGAQVLAPPTSAVAPPGYYMLFLLDGHGVPSVARWVRLGADAPAPAAEPAPVDPGPTVPSTTTPPTSEPTTTTAPTSDPSSTTPDPSVPTTTTPGQTGTPANTTNNNAVPSAVAPGPDPAPIPVRPVMAASTVLTPPTLALKIGSADALRRSRRLVIAVHARRPGTLILRVSLGSGRHVVRLPTLQRRLQRAGRYTLRIAVSRSALRRAAPKGRIRVGLAARQTGSVAVVQADVTLK